MFLTTFIFLLRDNERILYVNIEESTTQRRDR